MPTYIYQTIPSDPAQEPRQFEVVQKMSDAALEQHPETGEPLKRVITGGIGIKFRGLKRSTVVDKTSPAATACGCATGKPHRHGSGRQRHTRACNHKHQESVGLMAKVI